MPLRAMNDLAAHNAALAGELSAAVTRVLDSGWYVLGREVAAFEEAFAAYCGVPHALGVGNGTDALELALAGVGAGRGDRIALAANAGGYGTAAVAALGGVPVYVDIRPDTGLLDPAALQRALDGGDVRAVLVTHLYGRLADMPALSAVAERYGAAVVEDCAQAHGARIRAGGRRAGSFGHAAAFSFYPTKNLGALGDGGAVVTTDPAVAARVAHLRQYGWDRKYHVVTQGRNSRLDEIQAAVLRVKLPYLDGWNARRVELARRYNSRITHPKVLLPEVEAPGHVAHLYVLRTAGRDALAAHLRAAGVPSEAHYPVADHQQPVARGRAAGSPLPVTEQWCAEVLSLPCYPEMTDADADAVADAVNRWEM